MENSINSKLDNLTYTQKAALEGEIAFALGTSPHDAEMKYRIFMLLSTTPIEYRDLILEAIKNLVTLPELEVNKIILAVENNEVPVWMWYERIAADIEVALSAGDTLTSLCPKIAVDRKSVKESIITSAFTLLTKKASIMCSTSAKELCHYILEETNFKFLEKTCLVLLDEIQELEEVRKPKSKRNKDILDLSLDLKEIMSFQIELQLDNDIVLPPRKRDVPSILSEEFRKENTKLREGSNIDLGGLKSSFVEQQLLELEKMEELKETVFIVQKTFNGSRLSTTLKIFKTEEEALAFVKSIEREYPELRETVTLEIIKTTI